MNALDIILLICFVPAIIKGLSKGFIEQVVSLISLILGVWLSFKFMKLVCSIIMPYLNIAEPIVHVIAFVLIFCAVAFGLHLIGKALLAVVKMVMLGWADKLLGVVFALLKTLLIVGVFVMLFNTINIEGKFVSNEILDQSVLYGPVKDFAYTVFPYFKDLLFK